MEHGRRVHARMFEGDLHLVDRHKEVIKCGGLPWVGSASS